MRAFSVFLMRCLYNSYNCKGSEFVRGVGCHASSFGEACLRKACFLRRKHGTNHMTYG